ncbi:MAG TPA: T9SS type A sorting domain-containing protein [Bacteroidota bacterium]|nr:T9SS type A sorting domain-containing protein [Bacteroidota bacterium]
MAKFCLTLVLVVTALFESVAAPRHAVQKITHPLRADGGVVPQGRVAALRSFPDTLRILAIMVQFQQDSDTLTTGNGRFDLTAAPQRIIDAPPRDSSYFADHLLFAKNYFPKASNGRQNVSTTVLGTVLTLSKQMKQYAPLASGGSGADLPMGEMIQEAWALADSANPAFPFEEYDLFVIFHAGAGHDVDLQSSIGYDPTPYDLPSLYFSLSGLQNLFGASFAGVPLKNHPAFFITNSIVLPETENRVLPASTGGNFLYQLSINGLIVANIASYLGLPDLFDTQTGGTAIGRFGLMDGQAIFSFSGLFPPEPCAWEKIFLGWTSPITVPAGSSALRAPAGGLYQAAEDTIYKVPISAQEYFLVENRDRDAHKNGETLTIRWNGQQFTKTYLQDDDDFNAFNVDSIYGTVVDVDELDWSLPGAVGYLGGILIWHIDETVIDANLATNTINANPTHRGVNLEEADGSQDIGQSYGLLDPGSGTEDGSPIDYWFKGNSSPVYTNQFGEATHPNSLSNSGARSHVTLNNFSDNGPVMTFQSNVGDAGVSLQKIIKRKNINAGQNDAPFFADIDGSGSNELIYTSGDSVYVLKSDLTPYLNNLTGLYFPSGGKFQPALSRSSSVISSIRGLAVSSDSLFAVVGSLHPSTDSIAAILESFSANSLISAPVSVSSSNDVHFYAGDRSGQFYDFSALGGLVEHRVGFSPVASLSIAPGQAWTISLGDSLIDESASSPVRGKNVVALGSCKLNSASAGVSTVAVFDDNTFSVFDASTLTASGPYHVGGNVTGSFAIADVNGDGQEDLLIGADNGLYVYNWNGVLLDNFPLKVLDGGKVSGSPIVAGLAGSSSVGIIFGSSNGQIYGYDGSGKALNGFPLQAGGIVSSLASSGSMLAAASADSSVYVWRVNGVFDSTKVLWKGFLADEHHSNYAQTNASLVSRSAELLPASLAYNWPNPVYDKTTNIRYYLSKPAVVGIKIYNMAGELVDQFSGPGAGNVDNEIQWNVSKVQSGVYFAQIRANASGEQKSVVIKIAVVK